MFVHVLTMLYMCVFQQTSADPLKTGSEGLEMLQLWREKVFKMCIQLRSKDIELRGEKDKLLSKVCTQSPLVILQYNYTHCV